MLTFAISSLLGVAAAIRYRIYRDKKFRKIMSEITFDERNDK